MKLKWYGTATLLFEAGKTRILIDPYIRRHKRLTPLPMDEAATANAVFITHPHLDHFIDIDMFMDTGIPQCYVSQGGIDRCRSFGISTDKMTAYKAKDEIKIGDLTVRAHQSRHCKFDAATILRIVFSPRTYLMLPRSLQLLRAIRTYKIAEDEICALEITDGEKRVMVLGSAGMDDNTEYPAGTDMLVFPYQGRAKMNEYMIPFLNRFAPKTVLADHFDNAFPPFSHKVNTKKFESTVKGVLPEAQAIIPRENEWIEI